MKLTKREQYAVQALLDMVNNNGVVKLEDISRRQNISLHFLEQIFRQLRRSRIVRSIRGPGGGYVMNKSSNVVTVGDVLDSVGFNVKPFTGTLTNTTSESITFNNFLLNLETVSVNFCNKTLTELNKE